jgi:hypothetical protein
MDSLTCLQSECLRLAVFDAFAVRVVCVVKRGEEGQQNVTNVLYQRPLLLLARVQLFCIEVPNMVMGVKAREPLLIGCAGRQLDASCVVAKQVLI